MSLTIRIQETSCYIKVQSMSVHSFFNSVCTYVNLQTGPTPVKYVIGTFIDTHCIPRSQTAKL